MRPHRKLAAIVFADIAGFSRQVSHDETAGLEGRRRVETVVKGSALTHGGRVVKLIGDAVMLEFFSAVEAVSCALDIQKEMRALNLTLAPAEPVLVRIGVHVGDVVEEGGDLYGNGVNIAQRVQTCAAPGGICISREVYVQIRPILKLRCEPVSTQPDKPMPEPMEVFSIAGNGVNGVPPGASPAAPPALAAPALEPARQVLERDYELDVSSCLRRGWKLVRTHLGLCVLATLIIHVIWGGLSSIKYFGALLALGLVGPLTGGMSWLLLRLARGQKPDLANLWVAFGPLFLPVVIAGVASDFPRDFGVWVARNAHQFSPNLSDANLEFFLKTVAVLVIPAVYFIVAWTFARLLVIDRGLDFWPALELSRKVVTRHWLRVCLLLVLSTAIGVAGVVLLVIGYLITFPVSLAAMVYAYEDIFGQAGEPPIPALPLAARETV